MRSLRTSIALVAGLGLLTVGAAFGATASSNASADIVPAIAISNTAALEFGQVASSGSTGTVSISAAGVRGSLGGVTLGNQITVSAASFDVTGAANNTYAITLPSSITLDDGASHTMTVDTFVSSPTVVASGTLSALGAQTLTVGATLHVGINQVAGDYTGSFNVAVDYN